MSYKDQDAWLEAGEAHLKPVSSSITNKVIDAFPKEEHASLAAEWLGEPSVKMAPSVSNRNLCSAVSLLDFHHPNIRF